MTSCFPSKDSVLMLHANDFHFVYVQEICCAKVHGQLGLFDLETNNCGVRIMSPTVIHRYNKAVEVGELAVNRLIQIGCECGDSALPRHVIAEHCHSADAGPVH